MKRVNVTLMKNEVIAVHMAVQREPTNSRPAPIKSCFILALPEKCFQKQAALYTDSAVLQCCLLFLSLSQGIRQKPLNEEGFILLPSFKRFSTVSGKTQWLEHVACDDGNQSIGDCLLETCLGSRRLKLASEPGYNSNSILQDTCFLQLGSGPKYAPTYQTSIVMVAPRS